MSNPGDKKPFALIRDAIPPADRSRISHRPGNGKCVTELPPACWGRAEPQRSIPHVSLPRLSPFTCCILRPHVLWAQESYCTEGKRLHPHGCAHIGAQVTPSPLASSPKQQGTQIPNSFRDKGGSFAMHCTDFALHYIDIVLH